MSRISWKVFALCSFLLLIGHKVSAQGGVKGIVRDRKTAEPLPYANVFLNNTSIGAAADGEGKFHLSHCPEGSYELKASYVGYATETRRIQIVNAELIDIAITMQPLEKNLDEVVVQSSRDKKWEKDFRRFEREFMGDTPNAKQCTIVNPWVVDFETSDNDDSWQLKAKAAEPVEVVNKALGYRLFFYIRKFEILKSNVVLLGDARFELLKPEKDRQQEQWEKNRYEAYLGTERHLFKCIIDGSAERNGYKLYTDRTGNSQLVRSRVFARELDKVLIPYKIIVTQSQEKLSLYKLPIEGRLEVHYTLRHEPLFYVDNDDQVSWLQSKESHIVISASGVPQEPHKLVTLGYWSTLRIADMLPLDYDPGTR